jgi:hypothetical protein
MKCPICDKNINATLFDIHLDFHQRVDRDSQQSKPAPKPAEVIPDPPEEAPKAIDPTKLNFQKLKVYAKELGINLGEFRSKKDITKEILRIQNVDK